MYTQKEKNLMRHETTGAQKDKSRKKRGSSSQRGDPPDYKKNPPKTRSPKFRGVSCLLEASFLITYPDWILFGFILLVV